MAAVRKPPVTHEGSPSSLPPHSKQLENLLQETLQILMCQLQAMQVLFRTRDECRQVLQEIQDHMDDWADAQEAQLAWEEYEMTGVEGTLSYDEY